MSICVHEDNNTDTSIVYDYTNSRIVFGDSVPTPLYDCAKMDNRYVKFNVSKKEGLYDRNSGKFVIPCFYTKVEKIESGVAHCKVGNKKVQIML